MPVIECQRCGLRWDSNTARKNVRFCTSCRARKAKTVITEYGRCSPWQGYFTADETTPVDDDGLPVLPGKRLCGMNDCVNPEHIEREE